jgi:DNA-binding NarL/FixJ family response regulator
MNEPVRVLVATKYALLSKGLERLINNQPGFIIVGKTNIELYAIQLIRQHKPDVVLIDTSISIETLRILRDQSDARLLLISAGGLGIDLFLALAAGVDGYLSKEAEPKHLYQAIQTLAASKEVLSPVLFY